MITGRVMRNTTLCSILVLAAPAIAQPDLVCGSRQTLSYAGQTLQEFRIPIVNPPSFLRLSVEGADGGDAEAGNNNQCQSTGGKGAIATAVFVVGFGIGELEPGGTVRFIIGEAGANADRNSNNGDAAGSGGGGSAVLYQPAAGGGTFDWDVLLVGGAGGGAYRAVNISICGGDHDGDNGRTGECGSDGSGDAGGDGGCGGNGGGGADNGGGGGGAFGDGDGPGGCRGFPSGGCGGGWGFGGGGGSAGDDSNRDTGGGGGYSGGGAGERRPGGGGGSYINQTDFLAGGNKTGGDNSPANGQGFYECITDNDNCSNAFLIHDAAGAIPPILDNIGNTNSIDGSSSCEMIPAPDRWYTFTATCDTTATASVGNSTAFNLALFESCGGNELACDLGTLVPVLHLAEISWTMLAGQTRVIRISNGGPIATYAMLVTSSPFMPANDFAANAQSMGLGETVRAQLCLATPDGFSACESGVPDVWFKYTTPTGCDQLIELDAAFVECSFSIHESPGGPAIQCQDNPWGLSIPALGIDIPTMTWTQPPDTTYYIRASSTSADGIPFVMTQLGFSDADGDGVCDQLDNCPGFDDNADADGDGVPDGCDGCPADPNKTAAGVCGCGTPDSDSDGDATSDCLDACPNEPALVIPSEPGMELTCDDQIDNDCDGLTDTTDPDCGADCPFTCADIDGSGGSVNMQDFTSFALCFNKGLIANPQCICSDLDGNGTTNLLDFAIFSLVFGTSSANIPPNCP